MQELRLDGPDDDDGFLALLLEPLPEGSTERVVAHGSHCGKEEGFAQARGVGHAHGVIGGTTGAALLVPGRDSNLKVSYSVYLRSLLRRFPTEELT